MSYDDLKEEIRSHALVTAAQGVRIIAPDETSSAPWLFDLRALLLQPKWLKCYAEAFWEQFGDEYPFQVCGMESSAISLITAVAMEGLARGKPVNGLFIRKSRKRHGLMKQLEGTPTKDPVILVDDLVNSGSTFEKQVLVLEREGLTVVGMFALIAFRNESDYVPLGKGRLRHIFTLADFGLELRPSPKPYPQMQQVWRFRAPGAALNYAVEKSAPAIDDKRVYFGTDAGTFYALDQRDSSIVWTRTCGPHPDGKGIFSSPALHDGTVFFGAYDGNVYALDAATGKTKWISETADWIGSSPALAPEKDLLFIGLEFGLWRKRGGIAALKMSTGETMWEQRTAEFTHCSPLYIREKNMVVVGSNDDRVYAYDADSGAPLWAYDTAGSVKSSFAYDPKRQFILFGSLGRLFYALSTDGDPVFAREMQAGMYSTPLVMDDSVYVASLDKHLYAFDLGSGELRWKYATGGRIFASPALIDGSLYIGSNDGCLHMVDPKTGKGAPVFQATERIVNKVAYNAATKLLFVPTVANEIYAVGRP